MEKTNRVQELRWEKNYSIGQLVRFTGLSRGTISKIENDNYDPTRSQMIRLARAFKKPVGEVFDLEHL